MQRVGPGDYRSCVMLKRFTITFRFTKPGEKKPGPVQRFVVYAENLHDAQSQAQRYAYPSMNIISVKET